MDKCFVLLNLIDVEYFESVGLVKCEPPFVCKMTKQRRRPTRGFYVVLRDFYSDRIYDANFMHCLNPGSNAFSLTGYIRGLFFLTQGKNLKK